LKWQAAALPLAGNAAWDAHPRSAGQLEHGLLLLLLFPINGTCQHHRINPSPHPSPPPLPPPPATLLQGGATVGFQLGGGDDPEASQYGRIRSLVLEELKVGLGGGAGLGGHGSRARFEQGQH